MPKLAGDTLVVAEKAIRTAHCAVGKVTQPKATYKVKKEQEDFVTWQSRSPGVRLRAGAKLAVKLKAKWLTKTGSAWDITGLGSQAWIFLSSNVTAENGQQLSGEPLLYSIVDQATGSTAATFTGDSTLLADNTCVINRMLTSNGTVMTYVGEGQDGSPACPLTTVTMPALDPVEIRTTFAGNSRYVGSTASQAL